MMKHIRFEVDMRTLMLCSATMRGKERATIFGVPIRIRKTRTVVYADIEDDDFEELQEFAEYFEGVDLHELTI